MSAIFPAGVATALQLLTAVNNTKVTLNVDAGIGDTTLTVDDASPLPSSGYVTFDDNESDPETVQYTGVSGNNLTGVVRGADNTSAGTHTAGANLEMRWNAAYHNIVTTELIAVEQYLSDRFGIGANPIVPSGKTLTLAATASQLVFGTTNTTTISSTAPVSSRVYTLPDAGANAIFVMTQGAQTIVGVTTFSASAVLSAGATAGAAITITPTSNQIVLGTTRTVTISAGTPATSSRTWSIPDITGNGTFAALEGTQTFSGAKTFSATLTMSGATIAMGSNKITGLAAPATAGDALSQNNLVPAADGAVGGPGLTFSTEPTTGIYKIGAGDIGIAMTGVKTVEIKATGTTNATMYAPFSIFGGPSNKATVFDRQSTINVSTVVSVYTSSSDASLVFIYGKQTTGGTAEFYDIVAISANGLAVIASIVGSGSPGARTYTQSSTTLRLALASGTYAVGCSGISIQG